MNNDDNNVKRQEYYDAERNEAEHHQTSDVKPSSETKPLDADNSQQKNSKRKESDVNPLTMGLTILVVVVVSFLVFYFFAG